MLETKLSLPSIATHACCTCARLLPSTPSSTVAYRSDSEKPIIVYDRTLPCCGRVICAECIRENERWEGYCPFCQIATDTTGALPVEGLREPPGYRDEDGVEGLRKNWGEKGIESEPPSYADVEKDEIRKGKEEDVLHHLHHPRDTIQSLSLSYNVPASVLRSYNNIPADNLLLARHTILIPASHYTGPSLSPDPQIDKEEDEKRKKIRRFMVQCKISEYEVAKLYLEQAGWEMEGAVKAWEEDERWEREHPLRHAEGVKGKRSARGGQMREVWRRRFMGGKGGEKAL